ncbi:DNA primase DnaG [Natrononativus amylolyticus]|uniref:DNA primase DnaG n=1 Tax=Natrononativus amylolyticus TaxID=2963434 RepID=UPI0020CEA608|nr:DNA primase DnaG [Natrononativus amylolyticus]
MEDTSKYLIHANVTANGVVERSDVVGAIFGQTEGLLGDDLDLRDLRQSQKVGRIDVEITSTKGTSSGHLTIATSLDKVETATLAASLETITRVGPCRATLEVTEIEDVRAAKRKVVVDRAKELLRTGFDDSVMSSEEILAEVREHVRVEDITEYEGLPAGPRVTDSDAIIVVEGRSDVLTLLKYGIKNAIAVEGTNVPDAVAELTNHRTVTAFLDGDRGGDLILEELAQVGSIDYVAFAPGGSSVEDLDHHQVFAALRNKAPYDSVAGSGSPRETVAVTDGSTATGPPSEAPSSTDRPAPDADSSAAEPSELAKPTAAPAEADPAAATTVYDHASAVVRAGTDQVRFLADGTILAEEAVGEAYDTLAELEPAPTTVVLDGILSQRLLDLAADRGVERIVARSLGQFTKRPTDVRIHAIDDIAETAPDSH